MALDVDVGLDNLPHGWREVASLHVECAAGFQLSQQSIADLHVMDEASSECGDPMLLAIDGHVAFHGREDARFQVGRMELRIRPEVQKSPASLLLFYVPDECIREDF